MSTVAFLQSANLTTDAATYTFSSQNFGTAGAGRYLIVGIASRKSGAATTLDSVTIGGVTATVIATAVNPTVSTTITALAIAAVPTGASGDVVVTFGATMARCWIALYSSLDLTNVTEFDSAISTGPNDPTGTLDCPAGGFVVGVAATAASSSATWAGITEDADVVVESALTCTAASDDFASTQTNLACTADFSGTPANSAGSFASWPAAGSSTDVTVTPSLLTATLTLHAPTVSATRSVTVSPSLLTMTATLHEPTVSAGADATVTPSLLSMALTIHEPVTETYQIARPVADVSVGNWTTDLGGTTDLYATLDETTADDDDFIQSPESPADWDETKVRLASMVDPHTSEGHAIRFRYQKDSGTDRIDLMVSLYRADGTTLVTQVGYADIGTDLTDGVIVLSAPNADDIPSDDYAIGLVVGFAAIENTGVGGGVPPWI